MDLASRQRRVRIREMLDLQPGFREAHRLRAPLDGLPLMVVSAGAAGRPPEEQRIWDELQADLTGLSDNVRHVVAQNAGHHIHLDDPSVIVWAIEEMVGMFHGRPGAGHGPVLQHD
jgi:pimeloyl-ACP methyl ester carboxylesterase